MVFVIVYTPWPTSMGLDHPYLHVYAFLLLCFMLVVAFLVLGFATLDALSGFGGCVVMSNAHEALFGCDYLGCITMMPIAPCIPFPFFAPCDDMLAMLVCDTHWLSMHLYTLAYMFMHESCLLVCHPYFNIIKLWTPDPNLHPSLVDTTFCLLSCFFACHAYHVYPLYSFSYALHLFLPWLVCWFLIFAFAWTHMERTLRARAQFPMHKQKRHGCKLVNISHAAFLVDLGV